MARPLLIMSLVLMTAIVSQPSGAQLAGTGESFSVEAERLFQSGLEAYDNESYKKARTYFNKLSSLPPNQRSSAGLLMLGKTLFRLGQYEETLQVTRRLERDHEGSRYTADANLIMGDAFYQEQRFFEAASRYARLLATPSPLTVQVSAAERLSAIVKNSDIDAPGVDRLRMLLGPALLEDALLFGAGRWYSRLGWPRQSRAAMRAYLDAWPNGVFARLARESLGEQPDPPSRPASRPQWEPVFGAVDRGVSPPRTTTPSAFIIPGSGEGPDRSRVRPYSLTNEELQWSTRPRLGIILPLSGDQFPSAREVLNGIAMANEEMGQPFDLILGDSGEDFGSVPIQQSEESRLIHTVKVAEELIGQWGVVALVGPLFSTSCVAAANVAEAAGVPLIAPLAQQSGLDSLGQYIFQLRTVPEVQGHVLAEYATLVLGLQTFAVLAPLTDYGWNFERAFSASARANGGTIAHRDWYHPGATDYQPQFNSIRMAGFGLMPPPSIEDSLAVLDSLSRAVLDTSLSGDGLFWKMFGQVEEEEPDSSEIFIHTIDGLVVVVETFGGAEVIAQQIPFKRLVTQVLGNDLWYDPEALERMGPFDRANMEGSVFVSGRDVKGQAATEFTANFRRQFGSDPGYAAFGYDAARMLAMGWERDYRTRDRLRTWLAQLRGYEGASGRISFSDTRRVNGELILLKIGEGGKIRPLGSEDLPASAMPDFELPQEGLELEFDSLGFEPEFEDSSETMNLSY